MRTSDAEFDAHVVLPAAGTGPGIVVLQEIFGVGGYTRQFLARTLPVTERASS